MVITVDKSWLPLPNCTIIIVPLNNDLSADYGTKVVEINLLNLNLLLLTSPWVASCGFLWKPHMIV